MEKKEPTPKVRKLGDIGYAVDYHETKIRKVIVQEVIERTWLVGTEKGHQIQYKYETYPQKRSYIEGVLVTDDGLFDAPEDAAEALAKAQADKRKRMIIDAERAVEYYKNILADRDLELTRLKAGVTRPDDYEEE